jgi:hypothetical protein
MIVGTYHEWRRFLALLCTVLIAPGSLPALMAQQQQPPAAPTNPAPASGENKLRSADQLDSLVAPLALYPDPLLAQVLAASTYPLEIVQCARWLKANPKLAGEELTKAAAKEPWDPSVQALVAFPSALKLLDDNIQWTTDLGNAFLDQQSEVMEAVQRMRKKAKDAGKLESTKEQKVEVKTVETKTIIEVKPADPQVIYVPSYNPTVVYGPPVVAYPPVVYPAYSAAAMWTTAAVSFGVGVMMGAMWSGCCHGGYGWGCGWGGGNMNININNNFNQRYGYANFQGGNRTNISGNRGGNNSWQHNPSHRRSVPYSDRSTAQRFGGSVRDSAGRTERFDRSGRSEGIGDRGGRDLGNRASNRDLANRDRGQSGIRDDGGLGSRSGQDRIGDRGSQDRVGDRNVGRDPGSRQSAFSGAESRARSDAASNRGFSSSRQSSYKGSSARSSSGFGSGGGRSSGGRSGGGGRRR